MVINQKPSVHNTVFYSTANAGYAIFAAVSLLTVRKYLPDADLYILSSGLSDDDRKLLDKHSIKYHELDLGTTFNKVWEYPIDCYYLFFGPEFFANLGYDYSVYLDGDILCKQDPIRNVPSFDCVAGVKTTASSEGRYVGIFGNDWETIKRQWNLTEKHSKRLRINAGVVYFNNSAMVKKKLFENIGTLYRQSIEFGIPRKGDDSLFSLYQYVHLSEKEINVLPSGYNYVLQFHDEWRYPVDNLVFFHFSLDKPWKKMPYVHQEKRLDIYNDYIREWRNEFRSIATAAWLINSIQNIKISGIGRRGVGDYIVKIRRLIIDLILWRRGLKLSIFARRKNAQKAPLKLFWWRSKELDIKNFGDEISSEIIKKIFGYSSKRTAIEECNLLCTGSIIEMAARRHSNNHIDVWGSGFIRDGHEDVLNNMTFYAVRGEHSRARVRQGVKALGDPGLLANVVYKRASYVTTKIGVVVHYADADLPIVKKLLYDPRFIIIDVTKSPQEVARQISSCKFILSSSLHGLIFADSYGVPNVHVELSDRLAGGTYKFIDYYTSLEKEYKPADVLRLFEDSYLDELIKNHIPITNLTTLQKKIIKAFPY